MNHYFAVTKGDRIDDPWGLEIQAMTISPIREPAPIYVGKDKPIPSKPQSFAGAVIVENLNFFRSPCKKVTIYPAEGGKIELCDILFNDGNIDEMMFPYTAKRVEITDAPSTSNPSD